MAGAKESLWTRSEASPVLEPPWHGPTVGLPLA